MAHTRHNSMRNDYYIYIIFFLISNSFVLSLDRFYKSKGYYRCATSHFQDTDNTTINVFFIYYFTTFYFQKCNEDNIFNIF